MVPQRLHLRQTRARGENTTMFKQRNERLRLLPVFAVFLAPGNRLAAPPEILRSRPFNPPALRIK